MYASGDKVMRSAEQRDSIARDRDIIAFDTTGASACGNFSKNRCLVIKGVCDLCRRAQEQRVPEINAVGVAAAFTLWAFLETLSTKSGDEIDAAESFEGDRFLAPEPSESEGTRQTPDSKSHYAGNKPSSCR